MSTSLRTPMSLSLQGRIPSHMNKFHLQGESVRAIFCLLYFVVSQQWLLAGQYAFTTIADSSDPLFSSFAFNGTPAINNDGVVVFGATLTDGGEGIFAANGGTLTMLVDTSGALNTLGFEELSINSSGTVAFQARLDMGGAGIFTVNGGTVTTIAQLTDGFSLLRGVSINDAGMVAFYGEGVDSTGTSFRGIYTGKGGPLTTIVESYNELNDITPFLVQQPSINNLGDVAFFAVDEQDGIEGIYIGNGTSPTRIVDLTDGFIGFNEVARSSINDAGTVAFQGETNSLGRVHGVYTYSSGVISKIVDNSHLSNSMRDFRDLTDIMLNNAGTVAFGGLEEVQNGDFRQGVYTGGDPDADRVIGFGDLLDGSPVILTRFWGQGLNDRGNVAFFAITEFAAGIYLATPVPEPSAGMLGLMATLIVCLTIRTAS